jgi:uncharacterized protein YbjT (DUF2867 family)
MRRVLLTGASGFVGRHVWSALSADNEVRCMTRHAARSQRKLPGRDWVEGDISDGASLDRAMVDCDSALYLVHEMGEAGAGFRERELASAKTFAEAAARAGLRRIVYLGGVAPRGQASEHLQSRLDVGEALRAGSVPAVELRASMIIGHGSLSWLIVRDLAARLPVMVLPRWLESKTQPVAIDDVVVALVRALDLPGDGSQSFDIPGPATLTGGEILDETAAALGLEKPKTLSIPLLTPELSAHWVHFVTRARWSVAKELVVGLTEDLVARDDRFWSLVDHPTLVGFRQAAARAIAAEKRDGDVPGVWGFVERQVAERS